ncbi:YwmB family TATA-box binding protein [Salinibacillus xinjiangensis]|uniref:YwmB family TATA-box binding protein n=1 Tax=Salinibacillus xinjiangensis TaxID=1229268 RepID=A0A6G1X5H8_9BACI|nr:YwmB family TATA-box binding protein [Salinibacillus xinjiangensis]MRG86179.1 hypothetical protein [Salinibacillus xinjiangensis]
MFKKAMISIILLISFIQISTNHPQAEGNQELKPLDDIYDFFQQEKLQFKEWQVMMQEEITVEQKEEVPQIMKQLFPHASIQKQVEEDTMKYFINNHNKNENMREKLSIVHQKHSQQAQMKYIITGGEWNDEIRTKLEKKMTQQIFKRFDKYPSFFTCMKATSSDNIKSNLLVDNFQQFSNMEKLTSVNEENFKTISGYIHKWKIDSIPISHEEKMNIQLAVRNGLEHGSNVIVGTPILVVEY